MRILLTGSNGMVGRNLLSHASAKEFEFLTPRSNEIDLRNYNQLTQYLKKYSPDMVIHAAGYVGGIQANINEPVKFLLDNLDMGRNVVWAAFNTGIKYLINLGSSCMYPRNAPNPLTEDMILTGELEPTNEGYALAKIVTARLCQYLHRENPEFNYKTLIPCNIYGSYDKFDPRHSHMIPSIIHKLHEAREKADKDVEIWGDGNARREFMFAGDLADCLIEAIQRYEDMPDLMNVGLGTDYTINEYYRITAEIIGYKNRFSHNLTRPVGMSQKLVSTTLLDKWGWKPKTSLEDGIKLTYKYYLEYFRK